ncbi:MAG: Fic family protein [Candidatus Zapsychrus exili]|nr:Fic family protein [Candidatus Zapsychrus exili]
MNLQEKLKIIQKLSGLTQTELASKIGVSFVAFNNWWTGKSQPHKNTLLVIDDLYKELTGQKIIPDDVLDAKKTLILKEAKKYRNILKTIASNPDIYDQFLLSLTYNSNKIEGSTLSEHETADIMFKNRSLPNKSLIEQLEVKNHQTALQYLFNFLKNDDVIDKNLILKLHAILMNGIRDDAGCLRNHAVRIVGANVPTANYVKLPKLMDELTKDINKKEKDIVALVSRIHARFEQIHPFADGNGRIGRMIMTAMLLKANLAPAVIKQEIKHLYYSYLNKAQLKEEFSQLEDFICEAIFKGFDIVSRK